MDAKHEHLIGLWAIQDALLSSYWQIFSTIESIFFAASIVALAFCFTKTYTLVFSISLIVFCIAGLFVAIVWVRVCSHRGKMVCYYQWLLLQLESGKTIPNPYANSFRNPVIIDEIPIHNEEFSFGAFETSLERERYFSVSMTRRQINVYVPGILMALYTLGVIAGAYGIFLDI